MPRVGMARKGTKRHSRKHSRKHSRRCIFRYKHTRKQHRKQQRRQRGGVSDDLPTVQTVGGFPVVSMNNVGETSVSVQGFAQMSAGDYKSMAEKGELDPLA